MPEIVDNSALQAPTNANLGAPPADPTPVEPPQDIEPITPAPIVAQPIEAPVGTVTTISDRQAQQRTQENVLELDRIREELNKAEEQALQIQQGVQQLGQQPPTVAETAVATSGTFRNPRTGQLQTFSNVDINADNIIDQGLEFISGTNVSPEVRQSIADRRGLPSLAEEVTPETERVREINTQIDDLFNPQIEALDKFRATLSSTNRAIVDSITAAYDVRRDQMKTANANALQTQKILGIRSGRQRFAPEIQTGILSGEESAGIQRLAQLDAQEKQLIAEAERAAAAEDFELLNERMQLFREKEQEKLTILNEQRELALEREQEAREKQKQTEAELSIATQVANGVTDPLDVWLATSFDEEGNQIRDISFVEVEEALDVIAPKVEPIEATGQIGQFQQAKALGFIDQDATLDDFLSTIDPARDFAVRKAQQDLSLGALSIETQRKKLEDLKSGKVTKPPTQAQSTAAAFGARVESANQTFDDVEEFINDLSTTEFATQEVLPNFLRQPDFQLYDQARRNFINAVLREESGAVIADSEFENAEKQYFAQPGDSEKVRTQKRENRKIVEGAFKEEAGTAFVSPSDLLVRSEESTRTQVEDEETGLGDSQGTLLQRRINERTR